MKVDRLLELMIYLINHDIVPASHLAEHFHVSVRTIQRDIDSISAIIEKEGGQRVFWDFSVSKENQQVQDKNAELEHAIIGRNYVSFSYSLKKNAYRTFKIARMENLQLLEQNRIWCMVILKH